MERKLTVAELGRAIPTQPEGVERRLAAILAADVVGYSRLMAADEKGTHARLRALRKEFLEPETAGHHGRIVKLMGDGALVEFASVVDAVECAVAIQRGVAERQAEVPADQRIAFRIGINIGDIIIEDGDIYGGGVNIAARLEALAEPYPAETMGVFARDLLFAENAQCAAAAHSEKAAAGAVGAAQFSGLVGLSGRVLAATIGIKP